VQQPSSEYAGACFMAPASTPQQAELCVDHARWNDLACKRLTSALYSILQGQFPSWKTHRRPALWLGPSLMQAAPCAVHTAIHSTACMHEVWSLVGCVHSHDMAGASAEVECDAGLVCTQVVDVEHQLGTAKPCLKQAGRAGRHTGRYTQAYGQVVAGCSTCRTAVSNTLLSHL
jgi:hypothetical protein